MSDRLDVLPSMNYKMRSKVNINTFSSYKCYLNVVIVDISML
jgi:hypothetical protein